MGNAPNEISLQEYGELLQEGKREKDFDNSNDVIIMDATTYFRNYYLPCIIRANKNVPTDAICLGIRAAHDASGNVIRDFAPQYFHKAVIVDVPPKVLKINTDVVFHAGQPWEGRTNELHIVFQPHTQEANLNGLHVGGRAHFEFVQYDDRERTSAEGRTYTKNTKLSLTGSTFEGDVTFSNVGLDDEIDLGLCTFHRLPNLLSIADKAHIEISGIIAEVPLSGLTEQQYAEMASRFRTFRKIAQKNNDHQSDVAHFANEHRALVLGKQFSFARRLFFLGYDLISDYGRSIARPIQLLFVLVVGMAMIYALTGSEEGESFLQRPLSINFGIIVCVWVLLLLAGWWLHKKIFKRTGSFSEYLDTVFNAVLLSFNLTLVAFLLVILEGVFYEIHDLSQSEISAFSVVYLFLSLSGFLYLLVQGEAMQQSWEKRKQDWGFFGKNSFFSKLVLLISVGLDLLVRYFSLCTFLLIAIYGNFILAKAENASELNIHEALQLSLNHALVPLALIRKTLLASPPCKEGEYLSIGQCMDLPFLAMPNASLLLSFQVLMGTVLLFLIGVAIRHHLKLRW